MRHDDISIPYTTDERPSNAADARCDRYPAQLSGAIGPEEGGWTATVIAARVIGSIVRVDLWAQGQPVNEPLEAELSRERYEAEHINVGKKRWACASSACRCIR
jgi:hypothetical protein